MYTINKNSSRHIKHLHANDAGTFILSSQNTNLLLNFVAENLQMGIYASRADIGMAPDWEVRFRAFLHGEA